MCRPSKMDDRCADLRRRMIDVKLCCYTCSKHWWYSCMWIAPWVCTSVLSLNLKWCQYAVQQAALCCRLCFSVCSPAGCSMLQAMFLSMQSSRLLYAAGYVSQYAVQQAALCCRLCFYVWIVRGNRWSLQGFSFPTTLDSLYTDYNVWPISTQHIQNRIIKFATLFKLEASAFLCNKNPPLISVIVGHVSTQTECSVAGILM